jgi:hypothetical protein
MLNVFFKVMCFFIAGGIPATNGKSEKSATYTVYINFENYSVRADVLHDASKVKAKTGRMYYWYVNNDIKKTDGSFDGRLLHGEYKSFFRDMNLKEQGNFKYGLKEGEWKTWYSDGKMREIAIYNNGKEQGIQELYDAEGNIVSKTNYKNGVRHGKMIVYEKNKIDTVIIYRNGEPQLPAKSKVKSKPVKEKQNDSAKAKVKRANEPKDTIAKRPKSSLLIKKIFNKAKTTDTESIKKKM